MAQATMNVRMDESVKRDFDEFCAEVGMNASVAVNVFVRAVLRSRSIPFEITDIDQGYESRSVLAEMLRMTLLKRIEEGETESRWIEHEPMMKNARKIIAEARNAK